METPITGLKNEEHNEGNELVSTEKILKRRRIGFLLVGVGSFLCVFGFFITMFLLQQEVDFHVALYGTTGLGGSLLLGGMVAILG